MVSKVLTRVSRKRAVAGSLLLVMLALVVAFTAPTAQAYVYWNNETDGTIGRANLDGSNPDLDFITGALLSRGVAVNASHIFWPNANSDSIGRADLDGSDPSQLFITGAVDPRGVAVNASHIFWANEVTHKIGRANLDGSSPDQNFMGDAWSARSVAVNASHIFWASGSTNKIGRANLDGSSPNQNFIVGAYDLRGLAVNASHIFWANGNSNFIGRANLDGSSPNQEFIGGASYPRGVAVNASHIFWTNSTSAAIGRANLDGSSPNQAFIATGGGSTPRGVTVDAAELAPSFSVSPSSVDFGSRTVDGGVSDVETLTVTNGGDAPLTVSAVSVVGSGQFAIASNNCVGSAVPSGDTCTLGLTFEPTSSGAASANLQFTHDASGSPSEVPMIGTGASPAPGLPTAPIGQEPSPILDTLAPEISRLSIKPRCLNSRGVNAMRVRRVRRSTKKAQARGSISLSFRLSEAPKVTVTVKRRNGSKGFRACPSRRFRSKVKQPGTYTQVGSTSFAAEAGKSRASVALSSKSASARRLSGSRRSKSLRKGSVKVSSRRSFEPGKRKVRIALSRKSKPGTYKIEVKVTDAMGNRVTKALKVHIIR